MIAVDLYIILLNGKFRLRNKQSFWFENADACYPVCNGLIGLALNTSGKFILRYLAGYN